MQATSAPRKRVPADIKSFSHELNSKGVRPFPFWKPRGIYNLKVISVHGLETRVIAVYVFDVFFFFYSFHLFNMFQVIIILPHVIYAGGNKSYPGEI